MNLTIYMSHKMKNIGIALLIQCIGATWKEYTRRYHKGCDDMPKIYEETMAINLSLMSIKTNESDF